jgi:hypothetical protein
MIQEAPGYKKIVQFYGDKRTERSGVLLINHINEGIEILNRYGADEVVMEAYAVHPIFQADPDLRDNFFQCDDLHPLIVLYAMEYRNIANGFLSNQIEKGPDSWGRVGCYPKKPLKLSPLQPVNVMLVADKVQNRKDFLRYHKGTHDRSDELDFYFNLWLRALDISEEKYSELIEGL